MIINFHIKIIYLIKTYPVTAIITFCQEYSLGG